jgi:hypothetical protein
MGIRRAFIGLVCEAVPSNRLIQIWLGDGILLWRATVIWGHNRVVAGISSLLFVTLSGRFRKCLTSTQNNEEFTMFSVLNIVYISLGNPPPGMQSSVHPNLPYSLQAGPVISRIPLFMSFTINVWALSLVSYVAWLASAVSPALPPFNNTLQGIIGSFAEES